MSDVSLMPSQRSQSKFSPKQIASFFFKPYLTEDGDPTGLQVCKACGKTRKHAPKTGYTNLVSHVRTDHPRYEQEMEVLGGHESDLSRAEKEALRPFRQMTSRSRSPEEDPTKLGFADRILKRRKVQAETSAYVMLSAVPPTSNKVERLFSMARMIMRYERNRLSPLMLEMLLFLKINSSYWDVTTVDTVI
ncbi:hypothetical protein PPTG_04500 [Phytophthora nicotianae INRA-310]|uniref:BED-type domain-containing protein n=1 Tax=Phytophthora nicotianae (strain INRA-310) TaxID=761204 RepID=W2R0X0_PHYN3|nr:hypothetical protein PPTG_04500 [Phytophthora nicotianae INRA-310]ETN19092.1 hypothetical protein PPTG_04500 [Phytophthora nicotianae INRA-310]